MSLSKLISLIVLLLSFQQGPTCQELPVVDVHTKMTVKESNVTALEIQCHDGYNLTEGSALRFCTMNGTWSGTNSVCSGK